jgi:flagellar biosynthesis GTPase FlhF
MAGELTKSETEEILALCEKALNAPSFEEGKPLALALLAVDSDRCPPEVEEAVSAALFKLVNRVTVEQAEVERRAKLDAQAETLRRTQGEEAATAFLAAEEARWAEAIAEQEAWYAAREARKARARKLIETLGEEKARPIIEAEEAEVEAKELARWANAPMVENPYLTPEQRAYWDKVNPKQTEP